MTLPFRPGEAPRNECKTAVLRDDIQGQRRHSPIRLPGKRSFALNRHYCSMVMLLDPRMGVLVKRPFWGAINNLLRSLN
jgi:hypothetical protein